MMIIKNKMDCKKLLEEVKEISLYDWGEMKGFYLREANSRGKFTIDHEEEGFIGVDEKEAVNYIYRNRRMIREGIERKIQVCVLEMKTEKEI